MEHGATPMPTNRTRILFVAEAATLAHIARPLVLSTLLSPDKYDIGFACDTNSQWLLRDFTGKVFSLPSVGSEHFLAALARGTPLYDEEILDRYVRDDLQLFQTAKPDVIVGDFRLSLSISARLAGIPYLALSNCYWSPYWRPARYTVPNLPALTKRLSIPLADALFQLTRPIAFALHCRPMNRVRRNYGLPSLGHDLRRVYTDADQVLYADLPELFPDAILPTGHNFIGPLIWSPPVTPPDWWNDIPDQHPIVYLTLGSSGQAQLLPQILQTLAALKITVIASSAGGALPDTLPPNALVARYLPGIEAAQRANLVICNGGSPTSQQALAAGVPVLGIASNLDQFLNMGTIIQAGAGKVMRADRFDATLLRNMVESMLSATTYTKAAQRIGDWTSRCKTDQIFTKLITAAASSSTNKPHNTLQPPTPESN